MARMTIGMPGRRNDHRAARAISRLSRHGARLAAVAVLAGMIAGLPLALCALGGPPVPHAVPAWHQIIVSLTRPDDGTIFIAAVRWVSWLAWARFSYLALAEVLRQARQRPPLGLRAAGPMRTLATTLVSTALLPLLPAAHMTRADQLAGHGRVAAGTAVPPASARQGRLLAAPAVTPPADGTGPCRPLTVPLPAPQAFYHVAPGDDLWEIAARYLGNGERWHQIYDLNTNRRQPGGRRLTDPDLIYPGWILLLPNHPAARDNNLGARVIVTPVGGCQPGTGRPPPRHHPHGHLPERPAPRHRPVSGRDAGPAVMLPGGGLAPLALALAVSTVLVLASIQRRRHYRPGQLATASLRPSGPAASAVIASLRRAAARNQPDTAILAPEPPGAIPLGVRHGQEVLADLTALNGLGLTGPGAPGVARAILTTLLTRSLHGQDGPTSIILPIAAARSLLRDRTWNTGSGSSQTRLTITESADAALDQAEELLLRLARTSSLQETAPAEEAASPASAVLVLPTPGHPAGDRLRSILEMGRDRGLAALVLGDWPAGTTCHIAADGTATSSTPVLDGLQMYHLATQDAAAIVALLREAAGTTGSRVMNEPQIVRPAAASSPLPAPTTRPGRPAPGPPSPAYEPGEPALHRALRPADAMARSGSRLIEVAVLGPLRITAAGQEIRGGLRKARELLAFLALHPDGATGETISEALWPGSSPHHGTNQRHLALRKLRAILRDATGLTEPMFIVLASGRYRLDPGYIATDVAKFQAALSAANSAQQDDVRLAAWKEAAALYRGPLADGEGYDWAEPFAESARRRALDASTHIAELLEPVSPDQALAALEIALGHDPYNEYLYQRVMTLQASTGRPDSARRTLELLQARLAELDMEPSTQTSQFAAALLAAAARHHDTGGRPAGH